MTIISRFSNLNRYVIAVGAGSILRNGWVSLRREGLHATWRKAVQLVRVTGHKPVPGSPRHDRRDYAEWVRRYDSWTPQREQSVAALVDAMPLRPRISIVMPTYNTRREWLIEAIESVRAQVYPDWELCIADDASPQPHVHEVLCDYAARDSRIRVTLRQQNGHICEATNSALELASADWIALLDHDDLLPPDALAWVAAAIVRNPSARMFYSDEDKLGPAGRFGPYFKSDWNPDLFCSQNMFSHLGVMHSELVREVGGFRPGYEGSQDYDLALRCVERLQPAQVVHIPRVLYHWRVHEESTAQSNDAKPYAQLAAVKALSEHLERRGTPGHIERIRAGYRPVFQLPNVLPQVGVLLADASELDPTALAHWANLLRSHTGYLQLKVYAISQFEVMGVLPAQSMLAAVERMEQDGCTVVCLLHRGAFPENPSWLEELVRHAAREQVGIVGPLLLDHAGLIASAGVVLLPDEPGWFRGADAHAGISADYVGHGGRAQLVQELSAVRDLCMAIPMPVCRQLAHDGLLDRGGAIALSLAVRRRGLKVVWTPFAKLRVERTALARRSLGRVALDTPYDPAYSPNLFSGEADFSFAWPPLHQPLTTEDVTRIAVHA